MGLWLCQCGQVVGPEPYCCSCGCQTRMTLLDKPEDVYTSAPEEDDSTEARFIIGSQHIFPIRLLDSSMKEMVSINEDGIFKVNGVETNVDADIVKGMRAWIKEWSGK